MSARRGINRDGRRRDAGVSIVEIIVSIALMGTVVVATLNMVGMSIKASATSRSASKVETAIVNVADRVNRAPMSCDYLMYAQGAVQVEGWNPDRVSVTTQYYVPGPNPSVAGTWATGSPGWEGCVGNSPTELLVQRVRVDIVSPDGKVRRSIEVVKSNV